MFSRWMPPYQQARASLSRGGWLVCALLVTSALAYLALHPLAALTVPGFVAIVALGTWLIDLRLARRARERPGEDIGSFARAFDRRDPTFDPWVVRAVWDALAPWTALRDGGRFPMRPSDIIADLGCVSDDLHDVFVEAAMRAGRRVDLTAANLFRGRSETVGDLVAFIAHQPRLAVV